MNPATLAGSSLPSFHIVFGNRCLLQSMAEPVVDHVEVFDKGEREFLAKFQLQPEMVITVGMCGKIVLANPLENTDIRRVVKMFSLIDEKRSVRNNQLFHNEAMFMKSYDHPFLMKCLVAGHCIDYMAICTQYYQRGTLRRYLGALSHQLAELYVTQVACALRYLHKNHAAHLDVKLQNIFMDDDCNAILGDFGLSVQLSSDKHTLARKYCGGTLNYFAPERRAAPADMELDPYKLDSYCLGVVLWALVFKKRPKEGNVDLYKDAKQHSELPPNIRYLMLKLLKKDPSKRLTVTDVLKNVRKKSDYRYIIKKF